MRALIGKSATAPSWAHGPLQRKCTACGSKHAKGACPKCSGREGAGPGGASAASQTNDSYESEADRVAERVLSGQGAGTMQSSPPQIQRLAAGSAPSHAEVPPSVGRTLAEPGRALQPPLRRDMERRFGHDFSHVRVHTGANADASSRDVAAQAYTVGAHVVFANRRFQPEHPEGRRLLAHELTHVVQQGRAPAGVLRYAPQAEHNSPAEREADRAASQVDRAERIPVTVRLRGAPVLHRKTLKEEPAAGCGICYGMAALAGTQAHKEIQREWILPYLLRGFGAKRSAEVPVTCKGKRRRPDIVLQPSDHTWIIGSIKPARSRYYREGKSVFDLYSKCIKAADPSAKVLPLKVPISGDVSVLPFPNPTATGCRTQKFKVNAPDENGVYGYYCDPTRREAKRYPNCTCKKKKKKDNKKKGKKKQPKQKKPKKPTTPKKKPTPKPKPKPKSAGGAYNVGFGISLFSIGGGVGNAGVGISIFSTSTGFGTAGAGVSIFSDTIAVGSAGAGASVSSEGAAAGTVGVGATKESQGATAGAAGIGTAEESTGVAAGAAGAGKVKESELEGTGVAGKGEVKGSKISGSGGTGSGKMENVEGKGSGSTDKPVEAKDVKGDKGKAAGETGKAPSTEGKGGTGEGAGAGKGGTGEKAGAGKGDGDKAAGTPEGKPGGPAAQPGKGTAAGGDVKGQIEAALALAAPDSKPEDRAKAAEEAARINALLKGASNAQKALLAQLAQQSGNQYLVPASAWVDKLMQATKGITEADLEYLMTLDWKPSNVSAEELRKKVLKALENKDKPKGEGKGEAKADESKGGEGGKGKGQGATAGKGEGAGKKKEEGSAPAGEGSKGGPESGKYTVARKFTGEYKNVYERDYQFVTDEKVITTKTKVGDKPTMTLQWIGDNKKAYYYRLKYEVTDGPTEKADKKNPKVKWLYFTLKSTNTELIDLAPEGQAPFLIRPGREAWYRVQKP